MYPLISVDDLSNRLDHTRICDLRWDLIDHSKGRRLYEKGHIPGAVFVDLDTDLAASPGLGGRHPLPTIEEFAGTLGRLGITPDTHVVAYDDVNGRIASRLWWMLRSIGHPLVQVLDGGFQTWSAAGLEIQAGTNRPIPTTYPVPRGFAGVATLDELEGRTVVDARAVERYTGEVEPVDPKAGHIPGALSIPTSENLNADGRFLEPSQLDLVYRDVPAEAVVSCGSGVTACHDALAMVVAGRRMPDVYIGSFSEWSRHDLPVSTGPNP